MASEKAPSSFRYWQITFLEINVSLADTGFFIIDAEFLKANEIQILQILQNSWSSFSPFFQNR